MTGIVTVYAVFSDREEADRISHLMIAEELAACANILGQVESVYRWHGGIETASECAALFKTTTAAATRLAERIIELHSYENPAIAVWPITQAPLPYVEWVRENCA